MFLFANIFGVDSVIVLAVVALVFGSSQLPKLARSIGSAKHEFEKGMTEGVEADGTSKAKE
jgi:sec-independent protein translocase protein TatA